MCMMYSAWRFLIEFNRGDERPPWLGELSYSQVVSIVLFAGAGIWMFLIRSRAPAEGTPAPPPAAPSGPEANAAAAQKTA